MGIRAAGQVFGAAAKQPSAFAAHFLVDPKLEQVRLDELFASPALYF